MRLMGRRRVDEADTARRKWVRPKEFFGARGQARGISFAPWLPVCTNDRHVIFAGVNRRNTHESDAQRSARISAVRRPTVLTMSEQRVRDRRRAGRPPAGAKEGEKVKDYPQLSIRVPVEFK